MTKRIFISADHGMAIVYFLQSDVVSTILDAGVEIVLLTDDETEEHIAERFAQPGLTFEGLRLKQANAYAKKVHPRAQWLLAYLHRVGGSWRINNKAQDSHIWEVWAENSWKFRLVIYRMPTALATLILRSSKSPQSWSKPNPASRGSGPAALIYSRNTSPTWWSLRHPAGESTDIY